MVVANVEAAAYAVGVEAVAGLGLDVDVEAATSAVGVESIAGHSVVADVEAATSTVGLEDVSCARCSCRCRGCHVCSWT